jgi:hypothetical protein
VYKRQYGGSGRSGASESRENLRKKVRRFYLIPFTRQLPLQFVPGQSDLLDPPQRFIARFAVPLRAMDVTNAASRL